MRLHPRARGGVGGRVRVRLDRRARSKPSSPRFSSACRSRGSSCSTRCRWTRSIATRRRATPVAPTLFFEFHGDSERHVAEQAAAVEAIAAERGGRGFRVGDAPRGSRAAVAGAARRALCGAGAAARLRARGRRTSACRSRASPNASSRRRRTTRARPFPVCLVGHAGDGNFHLIYMLDPASQDGAGRGAPPERTAW